MIAPWIKPALCFEVVDGERGAALEDEDDEQVTQESGRQTSLCSKRQNQDESGSGLDVLERKVLPTQKASALGDKTREVACRVR